MQLTAIHRNQTHVLSRMNLPATYTMLMKSGFADQISYFNGATIVGITR